MTVTPFALTHVSLVTGDADGTVLPDQTLLVGASGRIEAVGPAAEIAVPGGHRVIDGSGRYALPGLINAHAHLFANGTPLPSLLTSARAERAVSAFMYGPFGRRMIAARTKRNVITQLHSGVTTLRSLGDVAYEAVTVRDDIDAGRYLGPRVIPSGPLMAATGGHGAPLIALVSDNPWDARRNVRASLRNGVGAIKIAATGGVTDARAVGEAGRPQMTEEEMAAICDEAHNAGVLVAAHAQSAAGITAALRAGVDTIEHGAAMTDEMIALFRENPRALRGSSALIPTFQAALPLVKLDASLTGATPVVHANAELILAEMVQGLRDAVENGVDVGMGTDSALTYVTHYNTWREIDLVARYGGIGTAAALHAATQANARILGISAETGSLASGLSADILVVDANPLLSLRALDTPRMVVMRGHVIDTPAVTRFPEIDAHLDSLAAAL